MAGRQIYNPDGFKSTENGFEFQFKAQYYRGFTLSILRDIKVNIDGEDIPRENVRILINDYAFTLEECRTEIDPEYRWEFGEYATVLVAKEGGLAAGPHHLVATQIIAPSYMPFQTVAACEADFTI